MDMASNPRTVEEIFKDFSSRRTGIVRALTYDVDEFYSLCDPEKENLCLYGHPNESWEVTLPAEEVPPELPEPALGINFARDGMNRRDWLSLVAVHTDSWLLSVAYYFGARLNRNESFEKVTFRRPKEISNFSTSLIHAVVFEVDDRETIGGSAYGGQRAVCCTTDLAKLGVCRQGEIIHRQSTKNPGWPHVFGVSFSIDDQTSMLQPTSIQITRTGMYNLYFIHCDPNLHELVVEGKSIWKNPNGYLPGRMAPLKNFYGFMSLAFILLGIFWFSQYARFWREVLPLQNCITLVITLGMFEMALWYFDYVEFNETGVRPTGITVWAVTFGTVRRTISRLIILMVSMGYGVVRPTLGGLTRKVIILGVTFFIASEVLELVENVGAISDFSGKARLFFILPVAILDAFFVIWIFTSLSATLNKLQDRRILAKLDIYRKFTNALAVTVIVSVGWICYELYFKLTDVYNEQWRNAWIIPAFWQVVSLSLLCVICALWAPSQTSMRYAYSEDASDEFDKDDSLMLIKPSPLPSVDIRNPEVKQVHGGNGLSTGDLEEDKTE